MIRYEAKWDNLVKMLTFILLGVLVIPLIVMIQMAVTKGAWELWIPIAVLVVAFGATYLYRPLAYEAGPEGIAIHRPLGTLHIPTGGIQAIKAMDQKELGMGIRLFGSGGVFGYIGLFRYKAAGGNILFYVTDKAKMVLIETTDDRRYMISPDDLNGFLEQVRKARLGRPGK